MTQRKILGAVVAGEPQYGDPTDYQKLEDVQPGSSEPSAPPEMTAELRGTLDTMQTPEYAAALGYQKTSEVKSAVTGITKAFEDEGIPIGLISKTHPFNGATLHFKIDDSESMGWDSSLAMADLSEHVKVKDSKSRQYATRLQEAEDRMQRLLSILAYIPCTIVMSYFDRQKPGKKITLDRKGTTPEIFLPMARQEINKFFDIKPQGNTPIFINLKNMLNEADRGRKSTDSITPLYILSDGEPSGGAPEIRQIKNLLETRNAGLNPVTFLGCSNQREDHTMMHEMEEVAQHVAAFHDYPNEDQDISVSQGVGFTYHTRGTWLFLNLAAALYQNDLGAIDKRTPLTKKTLEGIQGHVMSDQEYNYYFYNHPLVLRPIFTADYALFSKFTVAVAIPSVGTFNAKLKEELDRDIDEGQDTTEDRAVEVAINSVTAWRQRQRPGMWQSASSQQVQISDVSVAQNPCCCVIS